MRRSVPDYLDHVGIAVAHATAIPTSAAGPSVVASCVEKCWTTVMPSSDEGPY
jgi:hypothetical protein